MHVYPHNKYRNDWGSVALCDPTAHGMSTSSWGLTLMTNSCTKITQGVWLVHFEHINKVASGCTDYDRFELPQVCAQLLEKSLEIDGMRATLLPECMSNALPRATVDSSKRRISRILNKYGLGITMLRKSYSTYMGEQVRNYNDRADLAKRLEHSGETWL